MKTKFYWVALLASAALIGQAQGGGNHGGGGMGGGFSGGGHVSGGGGRAGPIGGGFRGASPAFGGAGRSFGVASRGGGVGFGMPHYQRPVYLNGRVARSVTSSISARAAASRPQNRFSSTRNAVGQRPAAAFNRPANALAAHSPGTAAHRGLNGRTDHIAERHDSNWHRDWDRRHAHFFHNRFFVFDNGFWCGLDDGFSPWDYLPYYAGDYYPYDYYTDVQPYDNTAPASAYPYGYYTGVQPDYNAADANGAPVPDPTVEATQERLAQLGYYNGPVDGIFGPTTRDAVANYQIDNQLDVTGSLSPDTLQSLGVPPGANSDR
ncbi:MAG TPA: peptidoglycan-binding domain-containing protein [Candidatus Udaeobacter sp.]|jgi:putative peptidoglycan binding protein|nr:peptidoglycan-binding domain-containing protein [Candidatus Udaeobacter sp.]